MRWIAAMAVIFCTVMCCFSKTEAAVLSEATQECLDCHNVFHPGIVADWEKSRHAQTTVKDAMVKKGSDLRISSKTISDALLPSSVGCAECHTLNGQSHEDTFEHNGYDIHVVVSPKDCGVCHATEDGQYAENLMSHAHGNLTGNKLYQDLQRSILGVPVLQDDDKLTYRPENDMTSAESCLYCHGTRLKVTGSEVRDTDAGELSFPIIKGWPNQGVGRINLDGSRGACSACHTRHQFSIEMARKPHTCKECHTGPDVPAYKVYAASKHGTIYATKKDNWDFKAVPWTVGKDFTAPTCATCHISLVNNTDGDRIIERSHRMNDRLPWRLFGLVYAHPHPLRPDLADIRNSSGIPLPTDFDGTPAATYLIDSKEQAKRTHTFQQLCRNCHDASWVNGHWERVENTIQCTNEATKAATQLMQRIWQSGLASGLSQQKNPFDEAIEKKWCDVWLIQANTIRFSSAMAGGGDYHVFANGYYSLSKGIQEMKDWYDLRTTRTKGTK